MRSFLSDYYDNIGKFEIADILDDAFRYAAARSAKIDYNGLRKYLRDNGKHAFFGLQPGACKEEIKRAYRAFTRKYHPDVLHEDSEKEANEAIILATKVFEELNKYAVSNPAYNMKTAPPINLPDFIISDEPEPEPEAAPTANPYDFDIITHSGKSQKQKQKQQKQQSQQNPGGQQQKQQSQQNPGGQQQNPGGQNNQQQGQQSNQSAQWDEDLRKHQEYRKRQQEENNVYRHMTQQEAAGYFENTLTPNANLRLKKHFQICHGCRQKYSDYKSQQTQQNPQNSNPQSKSKFRQHYDNFKSKMNI